MYKVEQLKDTENHKKGEKYILSDWHTETFLKDKEYRILKYEGKEHNSNYMIKKKIKNAEQLIKTIHGRIKNYKQDLKEVGK